MHEYDCYVPFIFENQYREAVRRIKLPENSTISRDAQKNTALELSRGINRKQKETEEEEIQVSFLLD